MLSNRLAFVTLAIACIGAAAGGGYLATRQNTVPAPASAQVQSAVPALPSGSARAAAPDAKPSPSTPASAANLAKAPEPAIVDVPRKQTTSASRPAAANRVDPLPRVNAPHGESKTAPSSRRSEPAPLAATNASLPQVPTPAAPVLDGSTPPSARPDEHAAQEPVRPIEPPQHTFTELVVSAES